MIKQVGYTVVTKNMELTAMNTFCSEISEDTVKDFDMVYPEDAPHRIARVLIDDGECNPLSNLAKDQEYLGQEFEQVLYENLTELYQS
jgi:hypothetical protein